MLEQLILEGGVTGGVTKWGYISVQLGLHIWGNQGGDRGEGKYRFFKIDPDFGISL